MTLLGAHTIGHVHVNNSGYGGPATTPESILTNAFDNTPTEFDNHYYVTLLRTVSQCYDI